MSRHQQTENFESLVKRSYSWHGKDGKLSYINDDGNWVDAPENFPFLLVESGCFSITGREKLNSDRRVKSNMGHQDYHTELTVKWKDTGDVIATGTWNQIKNTVTKEAQQAKWTANLFILFKDGDEYQIGKLMLKGRAVAAWLEFARKNSDKITRNPILIKGSKTYSPDGEGLDSEIPNFSIGGSPVTKEADTAAEDAYKKVHDFLSDYFSKLGNDDEVDGADRHINAAGTEPTPAGVGGDPFDEPLPVAEPTAEVTDDLPF